MISIGIAAGGRSTRFGSDKRYAAFGGSTLLETVLGNFRGFADIILSVDSKENAPQGLDENIRITEDVEQGIGPIEAISRILEASDNEFVFICAGDMPFVKGDFASYLASFITEGVACICPVSEGRVNPLCAIYSTKMLPVLEEFKARKDYRLRDVLDAVNTLYVPFPQGGFGSEVFRNINTYEDYLSAF